MRIYKITWISYKTHKIHLLHLILKMSDYKIHAQDIGHIAKDSKIAFVTAEFNREYTKALEEINEKRLKTEWFVHIEKFLVPWAFEIPWMAKRLLETKKYDLIINFWVVIRWDTPHFDYVCSECSRGILLLSLEYTTPIIFWVLTCNTKEQVEARISDTYALSGLNLLAECKKINL